MKRNVFGAMFFVLILFVGAFGITASQGEVSSEMPAIRQMRAIYRRLFFPSLAAPHYNVAGLRRSIAITNKAMANNAKRKQRLVAQFIPSTYKQNENWLDITVFKTPQNPNVRLHQIKVFVDDKEIFRSNGSGNLVQPGTVQFRCTIPRSSPPKPHVIRVLDSATGETITLHKKF